jgi:hypothetical protein
MVQAPGINQAYFAQGSPISNGREPKSCLGRVFHFKLAVLAGNARQIQDLCIYYTCFSEYFEINQIVYHLDHHLW